MMARCKKLSTWRKGLFRSTRALVDFLDVNTEVSALSVSSTKAVSARRGSSLNGHSVFVTNHLGVVTAGGFFRNWPGNEAQRLYP
jgi:hypothetical protein